MLYKFIQFASPGLTMRMSVIESMEIYEAVFQCSPDALNHKLLIYDTHEFKIQS